MMSHRHDRSPDRADTAHELERSDVEIERSLNNLLEHEPLTSMLDSHDDRPESKQIALRAKRAGYEAVLSELTPETRTSEEVNHYAQKVMLDMISVAEDASHLPPSTKRAEQAVDYVIAYLERQIVICDTNLGYLERKAE